MCLAGHSLYFLGGTVTSTWQAHIYVSPRPRLEGTTAGLDGRRWKRTALPKLRSMLPTVIYLQSAKMLLLIKCQLDLQEEQTSANTLDLFFTSNDTLVNQTRVSRTMKQFLWSLVSDQSTDQYAQGVFSSSREPTTLALGKS